MNSNYCITNLLKVISLLQNNSVSTNCFDDYCTKPFLPVPSYNTRVISLYKKDGTLYTAFYHDVSSSFFRIMNVHDHCCTLLILMREDHSYSSTNQTITIQISCIGAISCVEDTIISNL